MGDVLTSAFDSAGQRCSALRLLCVQADVAERQLTMLREALQEWSLGNPDRQSTDVGPVIDEEARAQIEAHIQQMQEAGQKVTRVQRQDGVLNGHFVAPAIIEIDSAKRLTREVLAQFCTLFAFSVTRLTAWWTISTPPATASPLAYTAALTKPSTA